jgi:hypothetical protein
VLTLTSAIRNTMTDAIVDSLDAGAGPGTIQIRSGTRPTDPSVTATGTLLATVTCADPAFGASSAGSATISDPAAVTAVATGTATWFRALDSNAAACFDGLVTATGGGGDLTLTTTAIVSGMQVDITGGTITVPQGTTP